MATLRAGGRGGRREKGCGTHAYSGGPPGMSGTERRGMAGSPEPRPRIVVTGAGGQLGSDLGRVLTADARGLAWQALTRTECDVAAPHRVRAVLADQARAAAGA